MRVILFSLLSLLFSVSAFAITESSLEARRVKLVALQKKVSAECIQNKDSSKVRIPMDKETYTCPQMLVITDRLQKKLHEDGEKYKLTCQQLNQKEKHDILAAQAADLAKKSVECKPSPDANKCFGQFACSATMGAAGPLKLILGAFGNKEMKECASQELKSAAGCLQNVMRGIFDSIWSSLKLIWDVGKWGLKKAGEWIGVIKKSEAKTSERAMLAQQAGPGFIKSLMNEKGAFIKRLAKNFYDSLEKAAINHYGCEKWSGAPFFSSCLRPMTTWKCGTCQQKAQVYCGIAGYAIGEIGTAFLTGGLISVGKAGVKGVGTAVLKIGAGPTRNISGFLGKTFPKSAAAVSKSASRVIALSKSGFTKGQEVTIAALDAVKNSKYTKQISSASAAVSNTAVGKIATAPLKLVGSYLNAMDKAYVAGSAVAEKGLALASGRAVKTEVVEGAKLADEALKVDVEEAVAPTLLVNTDKSLTVTAPTLTVQADTAAGTVAIQAQKGTTIVSDSVKAEAQVSKTAKAEAAPVKASDEVDLAADMAKYKTDPEYTSLFAVDKNGKELYPDHHKELALVIRVMEESQPTLTKLQIRKTIEEKLSSCSLQ